MRGAFFFALRAPAATTRNSARTAPALAVAVAAPCRNRGRGASSQRLPLAARAVTAQVRDRTDACQPGREQLLQRWHQRDWTVFADLGPSRRQRAPRRASEARTARDTVAACARQTRGPPSATPVHSPPWRWHFFAQSCALANFIGALARDPLFNIPSRPFGYDQV